MSEYSTTNDRFSLIGITGRKGHGKDTAVAELVADGYVNVKFAGALKEMLRAFLRYIGETEAHIDAVIDGDQKEVPQTYLGGKSMRDAMQTLGTEWGRNMIWSELWLNAFMRRANQFPYVVCTDMRFPNEVQFIMAMGGYTIRISRDVEETLGSNHPSETLIDTLSVDAEVPNNSSIRSLQVRVHAIAYTAK
jgi:hypothetical protein